MLSQVKSHWSSFEEFGIKNDSHRPFWTYKKLLDVYGKSDAAKELLTFKKENPFEDLTVEKIERLKELYSNVKDDILSNGMSG